MDDGGITCTVCKCSSYKFWVEKTGQCAWCGAQIINFESAQEVLDARET